MTRQILCVLFVCISITSFGQNKPIPRIEKDTFYSSNELKLYAGQVLLAGPLKRHYSANHGFGEQFRYVKGVSFPRDPKNSIDSITVMKIIKLSKSALNSFYVHVKARVHYADGSSDKANLQINLDEAVKPKNGASPDLIIP